MRIMLGKKYTFKSDKFLLMCKEIYVPEEINKVICPNGHTTKTKFCGQCGEKTTKETIVKQISDNKLVEEVWENELDPNGCWALSNIDLKFDNILVFQNMFDDIDEHGFYSIEDIKQDDSEYKDLFEKYSEKIELGMYLY